MYLATMSDLDTNCLTVETINKKIADVDSLILYAMPDRFITHVETNDLISDQDPETTARNIVEVANNSKTDTNKVLISSIVPRRDNLNGKGRQVNTFLKKFCMENDLIYVNQTILNLDSIATLQLQTLQRQHCNHHVNKQKLNITSSINQMVIR